MHVTIFGLVERYGYLVVFLLVGIESLGVPLPGETVLVTAAALAALGHLDIYAVIAAAVVAAIVGDNGGYWIGREGGIALIRRFGRVLRLNEHRLDQAHAFFERHGAKAVFLGRFVALLRTWAALLAGVGRMHYRTFMLWNALGAVVWASIMGGLGYVFGRNLPRLERYLGQATFAIALLVALVIVLLLLARRFDLSAERLWGWAVAGWTWLARCGPVQRLRERHPRLVGFIVARFTPGEYLGLHLTIGLLLSLAAMWVFAAILEDVVHHDPLTRFDVGVATWMHAHVPGWLITIAVAFTTIGEPAVVAGLTLIVTIVLLVRHRWILAAGLVVATLGGGILNEVLKQVVRRPRPQWAQPYLHGSSWSFPSGHAMGSLIAFGMFGYLLWLRVDGHRARIATIVVAALLIVAIGASRILLGVHYVSDVVGGYAAGAVWLSACVSGTEVARRHRGRDVAVAVPVAASPNLAPGRADD